MLRTRVLQRMRRNGWSTVAVTSTCPGEGKSLTAINVSISLALDVGTSVVLADLDLRKPSIHRHLGICARYGVGDFLRGTVALESVAVCPGIERLAVLTNDRSFARSSEMLTSPQTANLVRRVKQGEGRIAVFDMPPLLVSDDMLAFAPLVDAVLLVVSQGVTRRRHGRRPGLAAKRQSRRHRPQPVVRADRTLLLRRKRQPLTAPRATSHSRETRSSVANVRSCATASTPNRCRHRPASLPARCREASTRVAARRPTRQTSRCRQHGVAKHLCRDQPHGNSETARDKHVSKAAKTSTEATVVASAIPCVPRMRESGMAAATKTSIPSGMMSAGP